MEKLAVEGARSGAANGILIPDGKADHWLSGAVGTDRATKWKANSLYVKLKNSKQRVSKCRAQEGEQRYVWNQKRRQDNFCRRLKTSVRKTRARLALSETRGAIHWCDNRCSEQRLRYTQNAQMVTEGGGEACTIHLCRPCYSERLVQQRKQPLKVAEWRLLNEKHIVAGCGRSSEANNFCAECGNSSPSKEHGQERYWRMPQKKA